MALSNILTEQIEKLRDGAEIFSARPQADQRAGLEERLLLGVKPPFATGADRSLETQLSFIQNFLLVGRLGPNSGRS